MSNSDNNAGNYDENEIQRAQLLAEEHDFYNRQWEHYNMLANAAAANAEALRYANVADYDEEHYNMLANAAAANAEALGYANGADYEEEEDEQTESQFDKANPAYNPPRIREVLPPRARHPRGAAAASPASVASSLSGDSTISGQPRGRAASASPASVASSLSGVSTIYGQPRGRAASASPASIASSLSGASTIYGQPHGRAASANPASVASSLSEVTTIGPDPYESDSDVIIADSDASQLNSVASAMSVHVPILTGQQNQSNPISNSRKRRRFEAREINSDSDSSVDSMQNQPRTPESERDDPISDMPPHSNSQQSVGSSLATVILPPHSNSQQSVGTQDSLRDLQYSEQSDESKASTISSRGSNISRLNVEPSPSPFYFYNPFDIPLRPVDSVASARSTRSDDNGSVGSMRSYGMDSINPQQDRYGEPPQSYQESPQFDYNPFTFPK